MLKKISFDTLGSRILLLTTLGVLAVTMSVLVTMWITMTRHAELKSTQDIERAESVLSQILKQRTQQLLSSAEVLTGDFGFKQAVATHDSATIVSVLENHGARIEADLMVLLDLQGAITAASQQGVAVDVQTFANTPWPKQALQKGAASFYQNIQGQIYQIILLPVKAPRPIALTAVGFKVGEQFIDRLFKMTGTHISLVAKSAAGSQVLQTTIESSLVSEALAAPATIERSANRMVYEAQQFLSTSRIISATTSDSIELVLTVDLQETFAKYDLLRNTLLWVNLIALALSVLGGVFIARGLSRPLARLESAVNSLARGQQNILPPMPSSTREIKSLLSAFGSMQAELLSREEKIIYQANHDVLTGLMNRKYFIQRVDECITQPGQALVIANINIKGFKNINDSFGPLTGDKCLKLVGQRLKDEARAEQLVARSGADEFFIALVVPLDDDPTDVLAAALASLRQPYVFDGLNLSLAFNVGVVKYPQHGLNAAQLIRRSTIALDHASGNQLGFCIYEAGEEEALQDKLTLLEDLKQAFAKDDGQLSMHYQPKQNLATGKVDKCEALIRWIHPERGFVSPEMFVALAEQSGLINTLTDWVVGSVVKDIHTLKTQGIAMHVAINISAQDLERTDLIDKINTLLAGKHISPASIILELTERDMMNDVDKAMQLMEAYKQQGFQLSVDDYGIGHSSLSKLKQMPVDEIKIDKSFVMHLNESESDKIIVRSTIELGHNFKLRVIAEGVENEQSMQLLKDMGCDYMQGYFLARPMPLESLMAWLEERAQHSVKLSG